MRSLATWLTGLALIASFSSRVLAQDFVDRAYVSSERVVLFNGENSFHFEHCLADKCRRLTGELPRDISLQAFIDNAPVEWDKALHGDARKGLVAALEHSHSHVDLCANVDPSGSHETLIPECLESIKKLEKVYRNVQLQIRMSAHRWNRI